MRYWLILIVSIPFFCLAQVADQKEQRKRIIDGLSKDLINHYVSEETGKEMAEYIQNKLANDAYDTTLNVYEFTCELTYDLRKISKDKHILVSYPAFVDKEDKKLSSLKLSQTNWKDVFKKKDDLDYGNITIFPEQTGYLEFFDFKSVSLNTKDYQRIKLKSVLKFLSSSRALIIDLRKNSGGQVSILKYFLSFFIRKPDTYLMTEKFRGALYNNYLYKTIKDTIIREDQYLSRVNRNFFKGKKIYILTSKHTFSSAEYAVYCLRKFTGATVIGEQTAGGANGCLGCVHSSGDYTASIPNITLLDKDNGDYTWEAKGIKPDIFVDADSALIVARR